MIHPKRTLFNLVLGVETNFSGQVMSSRDLAFPVDVSYQEYSFDIIDDNLLEQHRTGKSINQDTFLRLCKKWALTLGYSVDSFIKEDFASATAYWIDEDNEKQEKSFPVHINSEEAALIDLYNWLETVYSESLNTSAQIAN